MKLTDLTEDDISIVEFVDHHPSKILVDMLVAYYTMELLKKLNKGGARE